MRYQPETLLHQKPGDLLFFRGTGAKSLVNRLAQRALDGRQGVFSHVAVCVYPGLFMHSLPHGGVQFADFENWRTLDYSGGARCPACQVLRVEALDIDLEQMLQVIFFWTGQTYNFRFLDRVARSGQAYCSQLAVQVLSRAGCALEGVTLGAPVTPSALFRKAQLAGAIDVSASYANYARLLSEGSPELWRLRNDPVRRMVKRAAAQALAASRAEFEMNRIATKISRETIEALVSAPQPALQLGLPSGAEFAQECADSEFVLREVRSALTNYFADIDHVPRHWLEEIRSTADSVRSTGSLIFIAHLQRLGSMVRRLAEVRVWMHRALTLLPQLQPADFEAALPIVQDMEAHLADYPAIDGIAAGELLRPPPTTVPELSSRPEVQELLKTLAALRSEWFDLEATDTRLRADVGPVKSFLTAAISPASAMAD